MARGRSRTSSDEPKHKIRPALSPEARENQMIALAEDLAEKQLIEGTASQSVITHYLKLGSIKQRYEIEKLRSENELLRAKTEAVNSSKHMEELMSEALSAFRRYSGYSSDEEESDDDY